MRYAERTILKALPKMERKATETKLQEALSSHRDEIEDHVNRLEEVFDSLGKPALGAKCDAMVGLVEEAEGLTADIDDAETMDAALIPVAQAIEHYEIARYGTLVARAKDPRAGGAALALKELLFAIVLLPPDQRRPLLLMGALGLSQMEAAEACGCAAGTVKSRVSRGRMQF